MEAASEWGYRLQQQALRAASEGSSSILFRKIATLDSDLAVEIAVVATGLLVATQLRLQQRRRRRRLEEQQQRQQHNPTDDNAAIVRQLVSPPCLFSRYCRVCSSASGWLKGVAWTTAYAYGGLIIVSLGRWASVLPLLLSSDQPSSTRSPYSSASTRETETTAALSEGKTESFFGHRDGEGGGGAGGGLGVALAMAVATAAICYTLAMASPVRRVLGHRWVGLPLGLAAELLRAACVAASAEIVLALVSSGGVSLPPSSAATFSPEAEESAAAAAGGGGGGNGGSPPAAALFLLSFLRFLAAALAGAAVSCVGGGDSEGGAGCGGEEQRRGARPAFTPAPSPPPPTMSRTPSVSSMAEGRPGRVSISSATSFGRDDGVGGRARRGGGRRMVSAEIEEPMLAASSGTGAAWLVPSGALGGAFYALTAGGVFGETMRKYLLGGEWFSCPDSVRVALAVAFAMVYLLRSLPAQGAAGFNPLVPCYRLLGFSDGGARSKQRTSPPPLDGLCSVASCPPSSSSWPDQRQRDVVADAPKGTAVRSSNLSRDTAGAAAAAGTAGTAATAAPASDVSASAHDPGSLVPPQLLYDGAAHAEWWEGERRGRDASMRRAPGSGATECHPSWGLPSPATAVAAASSASLKGRDGASSSKPRPSGPSAAVGGPQRADGRAREVEDASGADTAAAAAKAGGSTNVKGKNPPGEADNGEARGSQAPLGMAAGQGEVPMPISPAAAAPLAGGILEDRRRSVEGRVPNRLPGRTKSAARGLIGSRNAGGDERAGAAADVGAVAGSEGLRCAGRAGRGGVEGRGRRGGVRLPAMAWWLRALEAWSLPLLVLFFLARQATVEGNRAFWIARALEVWVSQERRAFFSAAETALLLTFPCGVGTGILAAAVMAAARVRRLSAKKTPESPVPNLVLGSTLTCLRAFGGNILACLVVGTRNMVLTEEMVWPSAAGAWILVGGRRWVSASGLALSLGDFLSLPVVHHSLVFLSEAFRALLVCGAVDTARGVIPVLLASQNAVGSGGWTLALVAGTMAGCGGSFLPGDRGLSPLSAGVPWAAQSALYGSAYYCVCCVVGVSPEHAQAEVSLFFVSVALLQTTQRGGGPRFNPLSPLHRVAYSVLGVAMPSPPLLPPQEQQQPQEQQRAPVPVVPPPTAAPDTGAVEPETGGGRRAGRRSGEVGRRASLGERTGGATAAAPGRASAGGVGVGPSAARWAAGHRDHRYGRSGSGNANGGSYCGSRSSNSGSRSSNSSSGGSTRSRSRSGALRGSSSRRGRGRGSRGMLSRAPGSGVRSRSRVGKGVAARRLLVRGTVRVWGPGRISERGLGRAFGWTVAAITVIAISRLLAFSILAFQHQHENQPWPQQPLAAGASGGGVDVSISQAAGADGYRGRSAIGGGDTSELPPGHGAGAEGGVVPGLWPPSQQPPSLNSHLPPAAQEAVAGIGAEGEQATRLMLAFAVDDLSSVVKEFSEASKAWMDEVATGDADGGTPDGSVTHPGAGDNSDPVDEPPFGTSSPDPAIRASSEDEHQPPFETAAPPPSAGNELEAREAGVQPSVVPDEQPSDFNSAGSPTLNGGGSRADDARDALVPAAESVDSALSPVSDTVVAAAGGADAVDSSPSHAAWRPWRRKGHRRGGSGEQEDSEGGPATSLAPPGEGEEEGGEEEEEEDKDDAFTDSHGAMGANEEAGDRLVSSELELEASMLPPPGLVERLALGTGTVTSAGGERTSGDVELVDDDDSGGGDGDDGDSDCTGVVDEESVTTDHAAEGEATTAPQDGNEDDPDIVAELPDGDHDGQSDGRRSGGGEVGEDGPTAKNDVAPVAAGPVETEPGDAGGSEVEGLTRNKNASGFDGVAGGVGSGKADVGQGEGVEEKNSAGEEVPAVDVEAEVAVPVEDDAVEASGGVSSSSSSSSSGSGPLTESDDPPLVLTDDDDSSASDGEEGSTLTIGGVGAPTDVHDVSQASAADKALPAAAEAEVDDIAAASSSAAETPTALSKGTDGALTISAGDEDVPAAREEQGGDGDSASWAAVPAGGRESSPDSLIDAEAPQAVGFVDDSVPRAPDNHADGPSAVVPANELGGGVSDLSGGGGAGNVEAHAERPRAARLDLDDDTVVEAARLTSSPIDAIAGDGSATIEAGADAETATSDAPAPLRTAEDGTRAPSSTDVADVVDAAALGAVPAGAALGAAASASPTWVSAKASAAGVVDFFRVRRGRRGGGARRKRPEEGEIEGEGEREEEEEEEEREEEREEEDDDEREDEEDDDETLAETAETPTMGDDGSGNAPDEVETHPDVGGPAEIENPGLFEGPADKGLALESHLDGAAGADSVNVVGVLPSLTSQALGPGRGGDGRGRSSGGDGDEVRSGAVVDVRSSSTRGTDAGSAEVIAAPPSKEGDDPSAERVAETAGEEDAGAVPTGVACSDGDAPPTGVVATGSGEAEAAALATGASLPSAEAGAVGADDGSGSSVSEGSNFGREDGDAASAESAQAVPDLGEDVAAAARASVLLEPRAHGDGADAAEEKVLDVDGGVGTGVALAADAAHASEVVVLEEDSNRQQAAVAEDAEHDRVTGSIIISSSGDEEARQDDNAAPAADSQLHEEADGGVEPEGVAPEDGLHSGGDGGAGSGGGGGDGGWGEGEGGWGGEEGGGGEDHDADGEDEPAEAVAADAPEAAPGELEEMPAEAAVALTEKRKKGKEEKDGDNEDGGGGGGDNDADGGRDRDGADGYGVEGEREDVGDGMESTNAWSSATPSSHDKGGKGDVVEEEEGSPASAAGDSKGWWARARRWRRAKAEEKAVKRATERAAAERKREFEQLENAKRLAIRAAEEREKELRLLDEAHQQQQADGLTADEVSGEAVVVYDLETEKAEIGSTEGATPRQEEEEEEEEGETSPSRLFGDGDGDDVGGGGSGGGDGGSGDSGSLVVTGVADVAHREDDGGEEGMERPELGSGTSGGRTDDEEDRTLDGGGDDGAGGVRDGNMETFLLNGTGDSTASGVSDARGFGGGDERRAEQPRLEELTHEEAQVQGGPEQEQGEDTPSKVGEKKEKKTGGNRVKGVVGVIAAAAYYAGWAVVTIALG